jgi:hypothetical protein
LDRIVETSDQSTDAGKALMLKKITHILASIRTRGERDVYMNKVWRFHPLASHSPGLASEQLHRDAETLLQRKRTEPAGKSSPARAGQQSTQPEQRRASQGGPVSNRAPSGSRQSGSLTEKPWRRDQGRDTARPVQPTPIAPGGPSAVERAERELIRALAEPEWRAQVLKSTTDDDFPSEIGKRFRKFAAAIDGELQANGGDLMAGLARHEDQDFSLSVRSQLQEINALMAKVPLNTAAIAGCVHTLRQHRAEALQHELAQFLQSKPVLTGEDLQSVREHQRMLRGLKGSEAPEGLAKE